MPSIYPAPRPPVLTIVATVSLVWSGLNMLRLIAWVVFGPILGFSSWLLGPAVGAVGSLVSVLAVLLAIAQSILTIVLFVAAIATLQGEPSGRTLHVWWASINIILDALSLLLTAGLSPSAWWGLAYAAAVLYVMGLPEVRAYFDRSQLSFTMKPNGITDDASDREREFCVIARTQEVPTMSLDPLSPKPQPSPRRSGARKLDRNPAFEKAMKLAAVTGLRALLGPALVAESSGRPERQNLVIAALGEMLLDKLPFMPGRDSLP